MLEAITFNKNEDGDGLRGNEGVEEKSEAQVETKMVAELRTANDISEIIEKPLQTIYKIISRNKDLENNKKKKIEEKLC